MKIKNLLSVSLLTFFVFLSFNSKSQVNLLTGFDKGSYYVMGNDIKTFGGNIISFDTVWTKNWQEKDSAGITKISTPLVNIQTSTGSQHNFNKLTKSPTCVVAFMQFDVLVNEQLKDIKKYAKKTDSIYVLLPLGIEDIHLITLNKSKIKDLNGLKGKRVAVGAIGQGTAITADFIKKQTGIEWIDFDLSFRDAMPALLNGQIDAFFFVGSAPVAGLNSLSPTMEQLKFVPISNSKLDQYYVKSTIPANTYHWQKEDVSTYGVKLILVSDISKETAADKVAIKKMLVAIKDNISKLQEKGHPNWKKVDFNFSDVKWEIHPIAKQVFGLP